MRGCISYITEIYSKANSKYMKVVKKIYSSFIFKQFIWLGNE